MEPNPPESGGRFTLRLLSADDQRVRYDAVLTTHAGRWNGAVQVALDSGTVELTFGEPPPPWLAEATRAALRTAWRSQRDGGGPWPRRLTRWRAEPSAP